MKSGWPRLVDAWDLVRALDTEDQTEQVHTCEELPCLNLLCAWAKQARLIRVLKGRVFAVAKARPVLADPRVLWTRLREIIGNLHARIAEAKR